MFSWFKQKTPAQKLKNSIDSLEKVKKDLLSRHNTYAKRIFCINLANATNKDIKEKFVPNLITKLNKPNNDDTKKATYNRLWWYKQWGKWIKFINAPLGALEKKGSAVSGKITEINKKIDHTTQQLDKIEQIDKITSKDADKRTTTENRDLTDLQNSLGLRSKIVEKNRDRSASLSSLRSDDLDSSKNLCPTSSSIKNNSDKTPKIYQQDYASIFFKTWSVCQKLIDKCDATIEKSDTALQEAINQTLSNPK